jgi:hypothetical protein
MAVSSGMVFGFVMKKLYPGWRDRASEQIKPEEAA